MTTRSRTITAGGDPTWPRFEPRVGMTTSKPPGGRTPCETWNLSGIAGPVTLPAEFPTLWEILPGAALARPLIEAGQLLFTDTNGGVRRVAGTGDCGGLSSAGALDPATASLEVQAVFQGGTFTSGGGSAATGIISLRLWQIGSSAALLRGYRLGVNLLGDAGGVVMGPTYTLHRQESNAAEATVATENSGPVMGLPFGQRLRFQVFVNAAGTEARLVGLVNNTEVITFTDSAPTLGVFPDPDVGPIGLSRDSTGSTGSADVTAVFEDLEVFQLAPDP